MAAPAPAPAPGAPAPAAAAPAAAGGPPGAGAGAAAGPPPAPAAVGGAGAAAPAVIQAAVGGVPAPAAMPAPAAEDSLIEQILTAIGKAGADITSRFKRWLWSAPITAPTSLAALSKLADTENLIYKKSGWVGRLEEIAREAQARGEEFINGKYRIDILLRDIGIAKQASKYAHLCGFDLMRRFLIYKSKYGEAHKRVPTDPLYKLSRRGLIKALLIYLLALADKAKARVSLFYIGSAIGIYEEEGNSNSAFEVGNGSSDKILIESMPVELKQNLNQFIEMLSTDERVESLLEPGGGHQQNVKLPLIRGLGDIDDVTTDAQRAAYDAVISSARAVIDRIEKEEAAQLRDYLVPNRGRVDYTSALEKLVNPPAAPPRGGGAGAGAGAALALLASNAGAAFGGGGGGAGAGGPAPSAASMLPAPYTGPHVAFNPAGGLMPPPGAAASGGGGGGGGGGGLLALPARNAAGAGAGAGAASASGSSSSSAAAAPALLPPGFLAAAAAGAPPPPPPPPGGDGAGAVEDNNSNSNSSNNGTSYTAGAGVGSRRGRARPPAAAAGGGGGGAGAAAAPNEGAAAAAAPNPAKKKRQGDKEGKQSAGARRTRRHRSARKSHRHKGNRSAHHKGNHSASRKGHKSTRKQSKKHRSTRKH